MSEKNEHVPSRAARASWIILTVVSALSLLIGLGDFFLAGNGDPALVESMAGIPWTEVKTSEPLMANLVNLLSRILGAWLIGFSILALAISTTAFRKVDKWAWYALWALPLTFLLIFVAFLTATRVPGAPIPPALFSAPGLFLLSVLGLLLSVRGIF